MNLAIEFLPDRLNREPTVFRGLTTNEMFIALAAGLILGLCVGIFPALAFGIWALVPTGALAGATIAVLLGGKYLARLKRGRSDTWLYRAIGAWFSRHGFGERLVQQSTVWVIRRSVDI